jgi:hypothetical protein
MNFLSVWLAEQARLWTGRFVYAGALMDTLHRVVVVPSEAIPEGPDGDLDGWLVHIQPLD